MKSLKFIFWTFAAAFSLAACTTEEQDGGQFTVNVIAGANGTATADKTEAAPGDEVTITAVPDEGFSFGAWTVTSGNATLADATAAVTTFTMPAGDVEITASFNEGSAADDTEDILPLLNDPGIKEYVELRMSSMEKIENVTYPAWDQGDGKLTEKEASEVTAMNLTVMAGTIASLEDLKYFPNLEVLILDEVWAESGLEYLSQLPKLKVFRANNANLGSLDFSKCADLNTVVCQQADLNAISVSECTNLVELDVFYTNVSGTLDLSACSGLVRLDIGLTSVSSLDVSGCQQLEYLEAASAEALSHIALPQNSRIAHMVLNDCQFPSEDLDMTQHPNVTFLSVGGNPNLKALDLTKCTKLTTLSCSESPVGKLDLSNCPDIDLLWAQHCQLTEINLSGCSKLFEIYVQHNYLKEVDVSECGFYIDEETGAMTNTFLYHLGAQVEPGTEPFSYDEEDLGSSIDHLAWAGLTAPNGHYAVPREVTIYLSETQRPYWESSCGSLQVNSGEKGEALMYGGTAYSDEGFAPPLNLGNTNVVYID